MKTYPAYIAAALVLAAATAPITAAQAATRTMTTNAWIPYWKEDAGIAEARQNLSTLTSVSPFGFTVDSNGRVVDKMGITSDPWKTFIRDAEQRNVQLYPTVSWFDGAAIHATLSDSKKRQQHIDDIMSNVLGANSAFDGVEIDYEAKLSETNVYFSLFLLQLSLRLKAQKKLLVCDIEPRTPVQDRFSNPTTETIKKATMYANNYALIGIACDEVRIMAYDQGLSDLTLLRSGSRPYAPIADAAWVKKVIGQTTPPIPKDKLVLGIPTYGRVYRVDSLGYNQIASVSYTAAMDLAKQQNVTPTRGRSGELGFSYQGLTSGLPGNATPTGVMNQYYVTFADAVSMNANRALAQQMGLKGVAYFKIDGDTDQAIWKTAR